MKEIVEDTISRNKKFQEERRLRLNRLKELKAPDIIIKTEEMISKMTLAEFKIYNQLFEEEDKKIKAEYAKNNPIKKSIVDEIYNRESKLEYDYFTYSSDVHLIGAIDPLKFMSKDDYDNDLYRTFLEHAKELYRDRFKKQFGVEE
jgi:succinate dehydrogenase flavin-adding protein (antitoxin of CptAB toxin-antitoxin module)